MSLHRREPSGSLPAVLAWGSVVVAMFAVWFSRASGAALLDDSDTRGLLIGIQERRNPLSWFWTDWPIYNHFYRPFPSLAFEWDNWAHPGSAAGFGATNAILVALCVGLLAWVATLFFESEICGAAAALVFTTWLLPGLSNFSELIPLGVGLWVVWRVWRRKDRPVAWQMICLLLLIWAECHALERLYFRSIAWLPGRTATVMTVFALFSFGAFLMGAKSGSKRWFAGAMVGLLCALASYEQAVMIPLIVSVFVVLLGDKRLWRWVGLTWGLLVAYLAFRVQIIPPTVSRYQDQQFRTGPGVWLSLSAYLAPPLAYVTSLKIAVESSFTPFLVSGAPWWGVTQFPAYFGSAASLVQQRRWREPLFLLLASSLAFAPMAFLKPFEHYHFWPMTWRAMLLVSLVQIVAIQEEADE